MKRQWNLSQEDIKNAIIMWLKAQNHRDSEALFVDGRVEVTFEIVPAYDSLDRSLGYSQLTGAEVREV